MITIIDILRNADYNLQKNGLIGLEVGKEQLHRAVELLEEGKELYDKIESFLSD